MQDIDFSVDRAYIPVNERGKSSNKSNNKKKNIELKIQTLQINYQFWRKRRRKSLSVFENKFTKKPVTMDGSGGPLRGLFGSFRICGSKRARWENFEGWATIKQLIKNVKFTGTFLFFRVQCFGTNLTIGVTVNSFILTGKKPTINLWQEFCVPKNNQNYSQNLHEFSFEIHSSDHNSKLYRNKSIFETHILCLPDKMGDFNLRKSFYHTDPTKITNASLFRRWQ